MRESKPKHLCLDFNLLPLLCLGVSGDEEFPLESLVYFERDSLLALQARADKAISLRVSTLSESIQLPLCLLAKYIKLLSFFKQ
ncbi:hypothetical protein [Helicobacter marmotae]|uniref:Uncharacterized protein n=1 Tax=Helicobacter marmotae TaxID=152490 RepID=A0A3D8I5C2_9HELI|nr:hypothetical protein [Helicobacter marmotae]RDU60328.1 hypothetical protein CQA63_03700 [Helicobacter marmotae]